MCVEIEGRHEGQLVGRLRTLWNSLPDTVVKAESVNSFKGRLDRFWNDQEVKCNWKADIKGTGSISNVVGCNLILYSL